MTARRLLCFFVTLFLFAMPPVLVAQPLPGLEDLEEQPEPEKKPENAEQDERVPDNAADSPAVEEDAESTGADAADATTADEMEAGEAESGPTVEKDERFAARMLNLDGTVGLQNIAAAYGGMPGTYRIALLGQYFSGNDVIRFNDSETFFAGNLLFEATPIDFFSANLRLQTRNNVNNFGRPEAMLSQGDLQVGFKGHWHPPEGGLYVGGDLTFMVPADFGGSGLNFDGLGVRPRLLTTFDIAELTQKQVYLKTHVNIGYTVNRSENLVPDGFTPTRVERFAYDLNAYDSIDIGIGVEYDFPYVTPFLGWNLAVPVNEADGTCQQTNLDCASNVGFGSFPHVLALGVKGEPVENLGLHLGFDFGLTSDDAAGLPVTTPWELVFGLQWTIDPRPKIEYVEKEPETPAAPPQAFVVGTVTDKDTGEPIAGVMVRYPLGDDTPQATRENGTFRSYGFAPGSKIKISLTHPDYEARAIDRQLPDEPGEHPLKVQMTALAKAGGVAGRVQDEEGNAITNSQLRFTGPQEYEFSANPDGTFQFEVEPGTYEVAASATGYLTRGQNVTVEADSTTNVQFSLKEAPDESLVKLREDKIEIQQKVFFDTGKATIQPRSYNLLEQVTALLAENPQVKKIRIEGHTDDVGSDPVNMELSQQRAEAVRNFLVKQGVNPERLEAKGYGEERPLLPNTSDRNRTINRRVEFLIMNQ